ncbi:putative membrane protein YphA (DoxX/SURF4 family) [Phycicoccus badiiscoriae]|uniref:Putative membrane protein YphA (DoxX/SURF4 family) n=1 Tax=Pedococcus badiiscoriae TaxID=642776 RepID=A0A852WJS0_9MICO|nr:MauE/DoxX family redox-associated membrane protein [Pedococcus badiiscoriae]NYG06894.1 putative membrane protein YphA (DoxX/SURF4 family) [Pedococcus badiiscoriae]
MWNLAAGPFLAAAGLLVLAGVPKVRDPLPLVRSLRAAGMPAGRALVRVLAVVEIGVGSWGVVAPGRLSAALVATAYLVFTAFVVRVLSRGGVLGSCGCFGKPDTPATRTHAALTGVAALAALAVALDPPTGAWSGVDAAALTTVGLAGVIGFLAWQVMAVLPTTSPAAVRSTVPPTSRVRPGDTA